MHRIDHATKKVDLFGAGKDGFTEGTPGVEAPTLVTSAIANAWQEEIARTIEARGIALNKLDNTQLRQAVVTPIETLEGIVRPDLVASRGAFQWADHAQPAWDTVASRPAWSVSSSTPDAGDRITAYSQGGLLVFSFGAGEDLPHDCTIKTIRVWIQPSAARAPGSRVSARYTTIDTGFIATTSPAKEDNGAATVQAIEWTGLNIQLPATDTSVFPPFSNLGLKVALKSGSGATPANDVAFFAEVRYTLGIV